MDHPLSERVEDLKLLKQEANQPGSERSVERQHSRNKMLARERIDYLLDEGSFHELDQLARSRSAGATERPYTDGVITGWGTVDGRQVFVFSQDFTVFGGALGEVFAEKIHKVMDMALKVGAPVIGLNDGAGARIQEGVVSLASYGGIFYRNVKASGVTPQISVIMGPCAGGAVYSPIMTDFVFMVDQSSYMFITGPDVVKQVTGEDVTQQDLGGARVHTTKSGVAQFVSPDDRAALDDVRYLLSFLPSNNLEEAPPVEVDDPVDRLCPELTDVLPASANQAYDMRTIVTTVADDGEFFEYASGVGPLDRLRFRPPRAATRSVWSGTSPWPWPACSTSSRPPRPPSSSAPAMPSTSPSSPSSTFPDSCPGSTRNTTGSSVTGPSCSTPTARRRCPGSRSSCARPTAVRTW